MRCEFQGGDRETFVPAPITAAKEVTFHYTTVHFWAGTCVWLHARWQILRRVRSVRHDHSHTCMSVGHKHVMWWTTTKINFKHHLRVSHNNIHSDLFSSTHQCYTKHTSSSMLSIDGCITHKYRNHLVHTSVTMNEVGPSMKWAILQH